MRRRLRERRRSRRSTRRRSTPRYFLARSATSARRTRPRLRARTRRTRSRRPSRFPLRNQTAESELPRRTRIAPASSLAGTGLVQRVQTEARNAVQMYRSAQSRLIAATAARAAQRRKLPPARSANFAPALSTTYLVLQRQVQLANERGRELQAQTDLRKCAGRTRSRQRRHPGQKRRRRPQPRHRTAGSSPEPVAVFARPRNGKPLGIAVSLTRFERDECSAQDDSGRWRDWRRRWCRSRHFADPPAAVAPDAAVVFIGAPTTQGSQGGEFTLNFDDLGRFEGVGRAPDHPGPFNLTPEEARRQARVRAAEPTHCGQSRVLIVPAPIADDRAGQNVSR